jgi:hypothetical protein
MDDAHPEIQLISNVVLQDDAGRVLLVKYDQEDERWWLPGEDLIPYQHPDDRAQEVLNGIAGLKWDGLQMVFVESFRGRRGWHVMFNYRARGIGQPTGTPMASWFAADSLPRTMHGNWEHDVVRRVLETG